MKHWRTQTRRGSTILNDLLWEDIPRESIRQYFAETARQLAGKYKGEAVILVSRLEWVLDYVEQSVALGCLLHVREPTKTLHTSCQILV